MQAREVKIPPVGKPRLPEAVERIIRLYERWGKAAAWKAKLGVADQPADVLGRPWQGSLEGSCVEKSDGPRVR
jgi:hypothetical protein